MKHGESQLQQACVKWFYMQHPNKLLIAVPNERKQSAIAGARMKRMGLLPGCPDMLIPVMSGGFGGLFIEMKYGTNKLTPAQKEVTARLIAGGYCIAVCYTIDEFKSAVTNYFAL